MRAWRDSALEEGERWVAGNAVARSVTSAFCLVVESFLVSVLRTVAWWGVEPL